MISISAAQVRGARGLLGWSGPDLAKASGVSLATIRRMETTGPERSSQVNLEAIRRAFDSAGVIFIPADGAAGSGVRLKV
jgi:hypothetical protein